MAIVWNEAKPENIGRKMLSFIKNLFGAKPPTQLEVEVNAVAPYKVPEPAATTPIPLVVEAPEVAPEVAPVVIPVAGLMLTVEGAGEVAITPKKKAPAKRGPAAAKKPRTPKAK